MGRTSGNRFNKETGTEHHGYGGTRLLVWVGIILNSRTDFREKRGTFTGQIYRDIIL
ncbi:hypothetical protein AVEN_71349-1, partial [Araneus ventricosus]